MEDGQAIYDQLNQWDKDDDFFVELVNKIKPISIADLGCGTGRLTLNLANKGYQVVGIDPDIESIETAKQKDEKQLVKWKVGTSKELYHSTFDLIMMTSHVAQEIIDDVEWKETLKDIYQSINIGGYLLFDARNPVQRIWEHWNKEETNRLIIEPETKAPLNVWHQTIEVNDPFVKYFTIYEDQNFIRNIEENTLNFRSKEKIVSDLSDVGFDESKVYGDWEFTEANEDVKSFIFVTKKAVDKT